MYSRLCASLAVPSPPVVVAACSRPRLLQARQGFHGRRRAAPRACVGRRAGRGRGRGRRARAGAQPLGCRASVRISHSVPYSDAGRRLALPHPGRSGFQASGLGCARWKLRILRQSGVRAARTREIPPTGCVAMLLCRGARAGCPGRDKLSLGVTAQLRRAGRKVLWERVSK